MRVLVLGGTVFLSYAIAAEAVRRGHETICAARGRSGSVPPGARLVPIDRDRPTTLSCLRGQHFDAAVDVAMISYPWVSEALSVLAPAASHWTYVSTVLVYADQSTRGQQVGARLREPRYTHADPADGDPAQYGMIKVACENAVRASLGDRALIVRPGPITGPAGPGLPTGTFGYWPVRMARGGQVVVPDVPEQPVQLIDVRDLASWILDCGERGISGTFNAVGPSRPLLTLLNEVRAAVGAPATELVRVRPELLSAMDVATWGAGPRSLPQWIPGDSYGVLAHDGSASLTVGLTPRPIADTATDILAHERRYGLGRPRTTGLSAEAEAEILTRHR